MCLGWRTRRGCYKNGEQEVLIQTEAEAGTYMGVPVWVWALGAVGVLVAADKAGKRRA